MDSQRWTAVVGTACGHTRGVAGPTPPELSLDPSDPAFIGDPYPVYQRLLAEHAILRNPATSHWLISRHADADRLLLDRGRGLGAPSRKQTFVPRGLEWLRVRI